MKKIIAYFFSLGLLFLLTSHAFSFESNSFLVSNQLDVNANTYHINKAASSFFTNTDTVIYNYDTDENENINTSISKKSNLISVNSLKSTSDFTDFHCLKSAKENYFSINFSRLPRFTFIILQVLRL